MILAIKTDNPIAELYLYDGKTCIDSYTWEAHRQLADTIHVKIRELLQKHTYEIKQLTGIVVYEGPGSFTGLRIGITVANTLSYALNIPISGQTGKDWVQRGIRQLQNGETKTIVMPKYGADVHITAPRK